MHFLWYLWKSLLKRRIYHEQLVETGEELNIIPEEIAIKASLTTRNMNMNLRGIGGHTTSLMELSEFTSIILASGEETQIHFFIEKGSVHTVLERPFLAYNNIGYSFSINKVKYSIIKRLLEEDYAYQYENLKKLDGKLVHL
ncbi:hypothetical protein O181_017075 [Austropuccinia psidii MF-1]|uniref:Uncharacterized protein n=1 Tax=Austropuccinia psidii MF-1 TaxID=1389203 RepID=A0A9Q3C743_9BASI|nr:hypothetical protein [Austropuccinia psidii MF-1]